MLICIIAKITFLGVYWDLVSWIKFDVKDVDKF